jgi:hypothetical protein
VASSSSARRSARSCSLRAWTSSRACAAARSRSSSRWRAASAASCLSCRRLVVLAVMTATIRPTTTVAPAVIAATDTILPSANMAATLAHPLGLLRFDRDRARLASQSPRRRERASPRTGARRPVRPRPSEAKRFRETQCPSYTSAGATQHSRPPRSPSSQGMSRDTAMPGGSRARNRNHTSQCEAERYLVSEHFG